jgi:hypothetical protein
LTAPAAGTPNSLAHNRIAAARISIESRKLFPYLFQSSESAEIAVKIRENVLICLGRRHMIILPRREAA